MSPSKITRFFIRIGKRLREIFGRSSTESVLEMPNLLNDMPLDIIGVVFSKLDHQSAKNFRDSSWTLTEIYNRCRSSIEGPRCEAWVDYEKGVLTLKIKFHGKERISDKIRTVPFDNWKYWFQNASCADMHVQTDSDIPENLVDKVFCCQNINFLAYKGDTINEKTLEKLNSLTMTSIDLTVNRWKHGMKGASWLESVDIIGNDNSFEEIIELIKSVPRINLKIKPDMLKESIKNLRRMKTGCIDIERWDLAVPDHYDGKFKLGVVRDFMKEMKRISVKKLWTMNGETSFSLGGVLIYHEF